MASTDATGQAAGTDVSVISASNRLGLDYRAAAAELSGYSFPIIDVHSHIGGDKAARIYREAAELYGISLTYTMSPVDQVPFLQELFGDAMRFIAVPNWHSEDKQYEFTDGYLKTIERFYNYGSRMVKFWVAPRSIDIATELGDPNMLKLNAPSRVRAMEYASSLGMYFMVHVADPDTWFQTKYADSSVYGTKQQQYEAFEELMDRFPQPWIAAHMGGWPEDLEFLTGLLERHDNLYLDTSACKWQVRELSKHSPGELLAFLERFRGRILFGSDIVAYEEHVVPTDDDNEMAKKASTPAEAFDLYASRYWALRTMFETSYDGESPIADPDLAMVEPDRYSSMDAPPLRGKSLPEDLLRVMYHDAAEALLEPLHQA